MIRVKDSVGDAYEIPTTLEGVFWTMDEAFEVVGVKTEGESLYKAWKTLFHQYSAKGVFDE